MKAVILAGGKGTRLIPYTTVFPKPLVPLGHQPILDIIIRQLAYYGFTEITLTLGHLAELIKAYFTSVNNGFPEVNIRYSQESKPTGTAGSLRTVTGLDDTFLVMNGDILTTLDYSKLVNYHKKQKGILTIGMYEKEVDIDLGVLKTDSENNIVDYIEKPKQAHLVSMGIYVYEPAVLSYIKENSYLDFPDLVVKLLESGEKVVGYPCQDLWLDIGRPDDYSQAQELFLDNREQFLPLL